ncbi:hypothetical protein ACHHYP_16061 [Achlya hypogyna]|uniref:FHA domain-containing protein n=1 Tax=Achlya hypogyna TaxID=1202772 RepID=A0A1V9Y9M0_ACHHY|nr:hypothetical protein ACHHYP_16061 [Achlya hypogyna]
MFTPVSVRSDELSEALHEMDVHVPPFVLAMDRKTRSCLKRHELAALEHEDVLAIGLGPERPTYVFKREQFKAILKERELTMSMSKDHCEVHYRHGRLYAMNLSATSTTQLNRQHMHVGESYELLNGSELCMFGWLHYVVQATCYEQDNGRRRSLELAATMVHSHLIHVLFMNPLVTRTPTSIYHAERLSFKDEFNAITAGLAATEHPLLALKTSYATFFALHKLLIDGCRVLHIAGHGLPGSFFFEGDASQPLLGTAVDAAALERCLRLAPPQPTVGLSLVVLLVCYSESMAAPFLAYGASHVVAVASACRLKDWVAPVFAQRLYAELATGASMQAAFDAAIASVRSHDVTGSGLESDKLVLLPHKGNHRAALRPAHLTPAKLTTYLARPPHHPFFTRCVVVTGPAGVGKSHLARVTCEDLQLRGYFDGGAHLIYVHAIADAVDAAAPDARYEAVQAEVSARLKAFAGLTRDRGTQPSVVLLDGCDALAARPTNFAAFLDSVLSSHVDWKLVVTVTAFEAPPVGFSVQSYELRPLGYEATCRLFCALLARAKCPLAAYHLLQTPGFDPQVHADVELWRVLAVHPITRHVLRGLPGTVVRVVNEIVAAKSTVDAWYAAYIGAP